MEEAQPEEHGAPHGGLGALGEELRVVDGVRLVQAQERGAERLGRLGSDLDAVLQHTHREDVGRVAREPQPELRVGGGRRQVVLAHCLQLG